MQHRTRSTRSSSGGRRAGTFAGLLATMSVAGAASAWTPLPVAEDPLVRMPGSQPADAIALASSNTCLACHQDPERSVMPGENYGGSMMSQAARDPLFWASLTVALQDSIWATGRPNAGDLCLRCHTPPGWLGGRSDPVNGAALTGSDFDGVTCDSCHRMVDPFFEDTFAGTREGSDWGGYWDEAGAASPTSAESAAATRDADRGETAVSRFFDGEDFYDPTTYRPRAPGWTENGGGQYFVAADATKRASFADANELGHPVRYSRYHKSRYFCATCHDVSNTVLANVDFATLPPGDLTTRLPSETEPAHAYGHIERTFSEFMLSDYALGPGVPGRGAYAPSTFVTSHPEHRIATCQDCHLPDSSGPAATLVSALQRPGESVEHPNSGQPVHDITGGNVLIPWVLASTDASSPNHDPTNAALLGGRAATLTLDLDAGLGTDPTSLLAGSARALTTLRRAARLTDATYDATSGALAFRVQNDTGHKLISGYPEGRRMWLQIAVYAGDTLLEQVNPYDETADTLRGLADAPGSPPLGAGERHEDALVYEVRNASALTGETHTFHIALGTGRYKDNRIPPLGFRIDEAAARQCEPVVAGATAPEYFTAAEYAGGYDAISLAVAAGADRVVIGLYYQTTTREYVEFLRDEINGTATTLSAPTPSGEAAAYVVQTDPFFAALRGWGDTIYALWEHNRNVPGAAPVLMTQTVLDLSPGGGGAGGAAGTGGGGAAGSALGGSGGGAGVTTGGLGTGATGATGGAAAGGAGTGASATRGGAGGVVLAGGTAGTGSPSAGSPPVAAGGMAAASGTAGSPAISGAGGTLATGGATTATGGAAAGSPTAGAATGGSAGTRASSGDRDGGCGCRTPREPPLGAHRFGALLLATAFVLGRQRRSRARGVPLPTARSRRG